MKNFTSLYNLSNKQADQFKKYVSLLLSESKKINLTAITKIPDIMNYHFLDSLVISKFVDFKKINSICDIGTGAGFPGIPIKIVFPNLKLILIEVNQKKIKFLERLIDELELENVETCPLDWRTFLRQTEYDIDLFVTRAAIKPEELIRIFKPASVYKNSRLVYWASLKWGPSKKVLPFLERKKVYTIDDKKRKLIFFHQTGQKLGDE